jgi:hypothetical protein
MAGSRTDRSERAAKRLERGLARSRAVVAEYRERLLLLREALRQPSGGLRRAPARQGGDR